MIPTGHDFGLAEWINTCEELQLLESSQEILHDGVDVGLEGIDLRGSVVLLQVLDDFLHVFLQVNHEIFLGSEAWN